MNPITPESILNLTDEEMSNIVQKFHVEKRESTYQSGKFALAELYGVLIDDPELEVIEEAIRERNHESNFLTAIKYSYLAFRAGDRIVKVQHNSLIKPWISK